MNNNNNKRWKTQVDVFRGFVKATLIDLDKRFDNHIKGAERRADDRQEENEEMIKEIQELKQFVAGIKAVNKLKSTLWGVVGGGGATGIAIACKLLF